MIIGITTFNGVNGITNEQREKIKSFLQGAVYCWCKYHKDEWFAVRDFLGGDNGYWEGTPLMDLYLYYLDGREDNQEYAFIEAGKAAGRLLKEVLCKDKRVFETQKYFTRVYRWTGTENEVREAI